MIKFYSDVTKKFYDDWDGADAAEQELLRQEEKKKEAETKVRNAYKEFMDAHKEYEKEYGKIVDEDLNKVLDNPLYHFLFG